MKMAIYDTRTGQILETRTSSAGSVPPLGPHQAWRPVPDECHPDTHRTDPMGLTCTPRPDLPVSVAEVDGELVIDGLPEGCDVLFHGRHEKGCKAGRFRAPVKEGERQMLFLDRWPYKPLTHVIDQRPPKAEREARKRQRREAALAEVTDPKLRAVLRTLIDD